MEIALAAAILKASERVDPEDATVDKKFCESKDSLEILPEIMEISPLKQISE
jgi:hypothetical protein